MGIKIEKPQVKVKWEFVDDTAKKIFELLHKNKEVTFLEIDMILNLVTTECNNNKYVFLLDHLPKKPGGTDVSDILKKAPENLYG